MASQWTIPKLVTWRVKDWASCFLACKIPIDVEEDGVANNSNTTNNNTLMFKRTKRKIKKKRSERKLSLSPPGTRHHHHLRGSSSVSPTSSSHNRRLSLPQPPASEEPAGFIVFCFDREDGGFDVVKEGKEERKEVELSSEKSPRTVQRKLIYGDQGVGKGEKNNSLEIIGTEQYHQADKTTCQETENVSCGVHDPKNEEEEDIDASDKSTGSTHSDEGRGSFAFPILGVEWMGSPVLMPTPDDLSPKKQKPIALGFQCCRF
ncbi:hypothetical protein BRARA_I00634 [Brassica rapa]|uniref:Protein BREAKING OF ASYMMETRY IN THE STOMATAL LINEAGE n=2 Tax=Brassica TaxID=3705 RepID=M4F4F5_BRACM|nr:protein BREAKING OF ASYMMETRY IN THE STOMATAL LINEAGE [Brassica rapa]XP_013659179.1 protein BREAKING OF ASYMMETRY IN THE STOMATAL LINEAGE [Brassica napus]RID43796.1 hypothetical protein BRARA_I00634 [Brassica rapa]CAF2036767.1 unnamed protein product [Brassica napus]CDY16835.1 BnaA09g05470D [Brassica napus]